MNDQTEKREKPYACADVDLPEHPRIFACRDSGGCLGLWLAMACYSRSHLTDGRVPKKYAFGLWGDPRNGDRLVDMVTNALLAEDGEHYVILRYAPRNQTREMVDDAKRKQRKRMSDWRAEQARKKAVAEANGNGVVTRDERSTNDVCHMSSDGVVPTSTSTSTLRSEISEGEHEREPEEPAMEPTPPTGRLPDWLINVEREQWVAAYERGVMSSRGSDAKEPWSLPRKALNALRSVVEAHCCGEARKNIPEWIERDVGAFVRAVGNLDKPVSFWSALGPDGLQKWHNEGRPGAQGAPSANPYDGPVQRAESRRRRADQDEARRNAVPAPIAALLATVGEKPTVPMPDERPSGTRTKAAPLAKPEIAREMTPEEFDAKRLDDQQRLKEFEARGRAAS